MKKKAAITMLALGTLIFLGAQPQMPHLQAMEGGPYCAGSFDYNGVINIADSYYDPIEPPILYAVIRDTSLVKSTNQGVLWEILPKGHLYQEKIKCVAAHPTTSDIVYKGVTGNKYQTGVMKSTNGGNNWFNLINGLPNEVRPSKLGIFPRPGYYNYLLLGMSLAQQSCGGYSLYRTTNGGSDWSFVDAWGSTFLNITDFSFDPNVPERVCFSVDQSSDPGNAYRGIWKSTDFGVTWSHIGRPDNMEHAEITCVAMVDENTIYAGYWYQYTAGGWPGYPYGDGRILKTTDGGNSWVLTAAPIFHFPPKDIVIDESDPSIFYVCYGDFVHGSYCSGMDAVGILRFENYGSSWSYHNNNLSDLFVYSLQTNKNDPNCLFAGTRHSFYRRGGGPTYEWDEKAEGMLKSWNFCISPHLPIIYSFATGVLHTSTDCGGNWNTAKTFSYFTYSADVNPSNSQEILREALIPVPGVLGWIWKSTNSGVDWEAVYTPGQHPLAHACRTINYAPGNPQRVYAGYGMDGFPCTYLARNNSSGSPPWEGLTSSWDFVTKTIAIDYTDDQILYIGDWSGDYGVYKSTNTGDSWIEYNEGFPEYGPPDYTPLPMMNELAIDPPSSYIYAATNSGLYRRMIGGLAWYRKGSNQINESKVVEVVVNPVEPNIVYCATEDDNEVGHFYTSPNFGGIWLEIIIEWPLSGERFINDLAIDANAPDTVYAGTSQGVYKYVDNYISGPISQNTILSGDWIVTGDITIPSNIILTLQPGTELYSVPNFDRCESGIDNSRCEIVIHGTLNPVGTETDLIKFTSLAASPQSRDWYGIRMLSSSQANIDYAHILYGYCGLMASFAQNTNIAHSLIQNNYTYGLRLSGSNIVITNNVINNNGYYGIYTTACNGSIESNDITKHTGYGIWINGSVDIISNTVSNEGFLSRSQYGIYFYNGFQNQTVSQNTIKRFGQGGILLGANNSVNINNCSITDNAYYGIKRLRGYGYDKVRDSEILEHETGTTCTPLFWTKRGLIYVTHFRFVCKSQFL